MATTLQCGIRVMKTDKRITSFDDHLDEQYGTIGTNSREKFQEEFETF